MKTVIVQPRQTLWDIAVEHCGSADAATDIARLNGLGPTTPLHAGQRLLVPEPTNLTNTLLYADHLTHPATSITSNGQWTFRWTGRLCAQDALWWTFGWADPLCQEADPCTFHWADPFCQEATGPYVFNWADPLCQEANDAWTHLWADPLCAQVQPCSFHWTNQLCALETDPYAFSWTNQLCAQIYSYELIWEDLENNPQEDN